jgi:hypothetical protein
MKRPPGCTADQTKRQSHPVISISVSATSVKFLNRDLEHFLAGEGGWGPCWGDLNIFVISAALVCCRIPLQPRSFVNEAAAGVF